MNSHSQVDIYSTDYDRQNCQIGFVHVGFGAFHRAHQAVYIDDYMQKTGDLNWGIAAVNLRAEESSSFSQHDAAGNGYLLKTTSPKNEKSLREVRSHVRFEDWSKNASAAENLLALESVKAITMTVTESGYYLSDNWSVNEQDATIAREISGGEQTSIYAFLANGLKCRMLANGAPISILCCDNIRANGDKLGKNFKQYLALTGQVELAKWVDENASFPNSMVDRIVPRATAALAEEITKTSPHYAALAIHGESFIQWVLQDNFVNDFPNLTQAGVEVVDNVDPYEEAKIRILNGGHTGLCYLGALAGHDTFDEAILDVKLRAHFDAYEAENVLPGLTLDLPFDKYAYCDLIAERFSNRSIADELARICMDGWSKFPIYVRPTLRSCLGQGISPEHGYNCIASWYVYARRFARGLAHINYVEPYWHQLKPLLAEGQEETFASLEALWADLPITYEEFTPQICAAIERMEQEWPV